MVQRRLEVHNILKSICENVYYQAPQAPHMEYPCIKYERSSKNKKAADNVVYNLRDRYTITIIAYNQDQTDSIIESIYEKFPYCQFDRSYSSSNLRHEVLSIFY